MIEIKESETNEILKVVDAETLSRADLHDTNLQWSDLHDVDLSYADLSGADLSDSDLRGADLTGAILDGTNLQGADLLHAIAPQIIAISGSRDAIIAVSPDRVSIGCLSYSLADWLANGAEIGRQSDYTEEEIVEYMGHLKYVEAWLKR